MGYKAPSRVGGPRNLKPLAISFAKSAIILSIGFFLSVPFMISMSLDTTNYITLFELISITLLLIGAPMVLYGIIGIFNNKNAFAAPQSTADLDTARIRFAVEQEVLNRRSK